MPLHLLTSSFAQFISLLLCVFFLIENISACLSISLLLLYLYHFFFSIIIFISNKSTEYQTKTLFFFLYRGEKKDKKKKRKNNEAFFALVHYLTKTKKHSTCEMENYNKQNRQINWLSKISKNKIRKYSLLGRKISFYLFIQSQTFLETWSLQSKQIR